MKHCNGLSILPFGGGIRVTIASKISLIPVPSFAEAKIISSLLNPRSCDISWDILLGSAISKSILLMIGMISMS